MIPRQLPSNAIFGQGLKLRVTACRKRLRINRSLHKVQFADDSETLLSESATCFSEASDAVRESVPGGGSGSEFREREAWLRLEQEVGIR
jgi:hypothetical protein